MLTTVLLALSLGLPDLSKLAVSLAPLDIDGDGEPEIEAIEPLAGTGNAAAGRPLFVFVEPRLLELSKARAEDPLRRAIERYAGDLTAEGFAPTVLSVRCAAGDRHRDGRIVLAFRRLMQKALATDREFAGAVFIGHFPEAMLVRSCNWRITSPITLRAGKPDAREFKEAVPYLRSMPELVAHRCETVLCDLDGDWEARYVEAKTKLPWVIGVFPGGVPESGGEPAEFETGVVEYEDFFFVDDGRYELREYVGDDGAKHVFLDPLDDLADAECSETDRKRSNRMAVPDVLVSRIDARGVACSPLPELLDENGQPKSAKLSHEIAKHGWGALWRHDPELEVRLLLEYFERNHRFRRGELEVDFRPASLACGLGSGFDEMRAAAKEWAEIDRTGLDLAGDPSLVEVASWFEKPAILRTVRAHSDPWGSVFGKTDIAALEANVGKPWSFAVKDDTYEPSLGPACGGGKLDFFLLKTLYENGHHGGASFYVHTGCEAISPGGSSVLSYSHPGYGVRNGAEALLFLADGLALVGRAKVFYDEPREFAATFGSGATFGAAWKRYFELESAAKTWAEVGDDIGRKRAYFWSVLGDWTLRLRPTRS